MGVTIRFPEGRTATFGDDVYIITIGRDPDKCQVVFPPGEVRVGREHCALKRVLARYRLVLNAENPVFVDGRRAYDNEELESQAELQLGDDGPLLTIAVSGREDLPETMVRGKPQPSDHTAMRDIGRRARLNRVVALASLCLLFVAVLAGWRVYDWTQREIHHLEEENRRLADLNRAQADAVERLTSGLRNVDQKVDALKPRVREALRQAAPSVYLVVIKDDVNHEVGVGTAWVAAGGILATNAHVAEAFGELTPNQSLYVRSNGDPPRDFKIARVELHPGYAVFQQIWTEHMPVRDAFEGMYGQLEPVGGCDVALMHVEAPDGLAAPLPLAGDAELREMGAGDVVGYIGYPMEAMAVGGVNIEKPTPQTQIGHVTAVTDYFLARGADGGGHLVQHSLPMTGGASGSPMINDRGQVVALINAMNIISTDFGRAPSATGVNFGQRADLLRELLDGRADAAQATRSDEWRTQIRKFPSLHERGLTVAMENWRLQNGHMTETMIHASTVKTDADSGYGTYLGSVTLEIPEAGAYLFLVDSPDYKSVSLFVYDVDPMDPTLTTLIASDEFGGWYAAVMEATPSPHTANIVVAGYTQGAGCTLKVYRADP